MSISDMSRTSLKNNKREKSKMYDSFKEVHKKRILKVTETNPNIKNMSKKELKIYREALQKEANFKLKAFWTVFIGLFLSLLIFGISKL